MQTLQSGGRLAENVLCFARLLRASGLPLGTGQVLDGIDAAALIGIESRQDLYACLFSHFVNRQSQRELFDQAFHIFWRNPKLRERMLAALLPAVKGGEQEEMQQLRRRLSEALSETAGELREAAAELQFEIDASFSVSERELLQEKDFEEMSSAELAAARQMLASLRLPIKDVPTRRFRSNGRPERIDMRGTLRATLRNRDSIPLRFKRRVYRRPPLVILVDISGSMNNYSRMFMHFMHILANDRDRVHSFLFATRLTNISRHIRHKDVDAALDAAAQAVQDWAGGTRIGPCLEEFNRVWSRRVLAQGAVVLLITDGLDRDKGNLLEIQMERLQKSCRQLIWLNPLLRYEHFEPRAGGIRAMLPWVDEFRSAHNLNSLSELAQVIA